MFIPFPRVLVKVNIIAYFKAGVQYIRHDAMLFNTLLLLPNPTVLKLYDQKYE